MRPPIPLTLRCHKFNIVYKWKSAKPLQLDHTSPVSRNAPILTYIMRCKHLSTIVIAIIVCHVQYHCTMQVDYCVINSYSNVWTNLSG